MKQSVTDYISTVSRFISESLTAGPADSTCRPTFEDLALALFSIQFDQVEPYRRLCQARGVSPATVSDWSEIPVVPTAAFKELAMTSLTPERRSFVFHSSGTSHDHPSTHFHDDQSILLYEASLWPWFKRHLLADASPAFGLLALTPPESAAPHSSLIHMFETIRRNFEWSAEDFCGSIESDGAWRLDLAGCLRSLKTSVESGSPLVILGTAFTFVHLIDFLTQRRLRLNLPSGSRVMETGGYKGRSRAIPRAQLHRLITAHLGIADSQIVGEYGMSEISSQAYDRVAGGAEAPPTRAFRLPPWARARIVSPETGREAAEDETGLIELFDLANVRSVMAIQTDDLGIRRADGFELIGRAEHAEPRGCSLMAQ